MRVIFGNKVRVSDPCYDIDTWCAGVVDDVLEGPYMALADYEGDVMYNTTQDRPRQIVVKHTKYLNVDADELLPIVVGVDSGLCGLYDDQYFRFVKRNKEYANEWYDSVCDSLEHSLFMLDVGGEQFSYPEELRDVYDAYLIDTGRRGIVSSTLHGDGSYRCYVGRNDIGKVVAFRLDYE